jgi:DNA-nicking Smr family endonuclease
MAAALMSGDDRRRLSAEDRTLWARVTHSVKPLREGTTPGRAAPTVAAPHQPPAKISARGAAATHAPAAKAAPVLAPLDRRVKARLARGSEPIDARIDLHGKTQSEAHGALLRFLRRAQREGARFALVITGKGARAHDEASERGVLRRQVPQWLRLPEFRAYVVGFEAAHVGHGGEGALYVRIRKSSGADRR